MTRINLGVTAHAVLRDAGGVAGALYIATETAALTGYEITVRDIRDVFRHYGGGVRKIGAGYYAVRDSDAPDVFDWVCDNLTDEQRADRDIVTESVLDEYPHGDSRAVQCWFDQVGSDLVWPNR